MSSRSSGLASSPIRGHRSGARSVGSSGNIVSAQPLPSKAEGDLVTLSAQYQIATSPAGLTQLLYALENSRPYIFIDGADISSQLGDAAPKQGDSGSTQQLSLQLDLHAFVRAGQHG